MKFVFLPVNRIQKQPFISQKQDDEGVQETGDTLEPEDATKQKFQNPAAPHGNANPEWKTICSWSSISCLIEES